ncbi:tRNA pseudouridine(13) synthase TruD [Alkalilimnicola sp. S0819]|nr:tRNA pseudouridine(13) synthase TruD [Alkalilimnicola sp. S0819]MPQ15582.1 tRNA pseudouridine(13) synthase TruD [Alkalilimnicola sp. S0819]
MRPLPYAHGEPLGRALLRASPEDFRVFEELPFSPTGAGEHLMLRVRKRGWNTDAVAGLLAQRFGVGRQAVSYAGLKDRWAVTEQWFSVHLPGTEAALPALDEGVEILQAARHDRKLRRGALSGNRFSLRLRAVESAAAPLSARLGLIARLGVPNYFGEQRFGRSGDNVSRARALLAGEFRTRNRNLRGILYSAARSELFNRVLAARLAQRSWDRPLEGDVMMLDGRSACFSGEPGDTALARRMALMDIHPTGPLPGKGGLEPVGAAGELEQQVLADEAELIAGLVRAGLDGARRALRLRVGGLRWHFPAPDQLQLDFSLPAGAYATAVVRELCAAYEEKPEPA